MSESSVYIDPQPAPNQAPVVGLGDVMQIRPLLIGTCC